MAPRVKKEHYCKICCSLERNGLSYHVRRHHLNLIVYSCPKCDFSSTYHRSHVREHIKNAHGTGKVKVLPKETYAEEEQNWVERCFGRRKTTTTAAKKKFCLVCMKHTAQPRKMHILQCHLKKAIFFCTECKHSNTHTAFPVQLHIKAAHKGKGQIRELPEETYQQELKEWMGRCFGEAEKKFTCKICNEEVKATAVRSHVLRYHLQQPVFCCSKCTYTSTYSEGVITRHIDDKHQGDGFVEETDSNLDEEVAYTSLCFGEFEEKVGGIAAEEDERQKEAVAPKEKRRKTVYHCSVCDEDLGQKISRKYHIFKEHLDMPIFQCSECPYSSTYDKSAVRIHIRGSHKGEGQVEDLPEKTYMRKLGDWMEQCYGERAAIPAKGKYKGHCKVCKEDIRASPRIHVLQHHVKRPIFYCSVCDKSSNYEHFSIKSHIQVVHNGRAELVTVPKEEYLEEEREWMRKCYGEHYLDRLSVKTEPCRVCKKDVDTRVLRQHVIRHYMDIKPFSCSACGFEMKNKQNLERHITVMHGGEGRVIDGDMDEFEAEQKRWRRACFGYFGVDHTAKKFL